MTFGVLGAISAAIADAAVTGMVATGIGTAATTGASAGLLGAGTTAALGSGLGAIGTGALVGSGLGAAGSALMGQDPGKGAAFGALGGGLTGGLTSGLGALAGSEAAGAGGSFGGVGADASAPVVNQSLSAGQVLGEGSPLATNTAPAALDASRVLGSGSLLSDAGSTVPTTANMSEQFAQGVGGNVAGAGTQQASMLGSIMGNIPDTLTKGALNTGVDQSLQSIQTAQASNANQQAGRDTFMQGEAERQRKEREAKATAQGAYGMASGGEVPLDEGSFILPADIVSALGNGSTDAGASFLDNFFGLSDGSASDIA